MQIFYTPDTSNWTDLAIGFGGVALGALISGVISWKLQSDSFKTIEKLKEIERKEIDNNLCLSVIFKLKSILEDYALIKSHAYEAKEISDIEKVPLHFRMTPIINPLYKVEITGEELRLVHKSNNKLSNDISLCIRRHNTMITTIKEYNIARRESSRMTPANVKDGVGRIKLDQDQLKAISPIWAELEGLSVYILNSHDDFIQTKALIDELIQSMIDKGIGKFKIHYPVDSPIPEDFYGMKNPQDRPIP